MASGFADICSLGGPGRRPTEHPVYYNFDVGCEEDTCGPCLGHLELGLKDICGGTGAGCTGGGLYPAADSFCATDHSCDAETGKCVRRKGSQSRPKRPIISACPASQTLCSLGNRSACVDTESDVEHCGGCAGRGGLDCTSLPGATDVDCVWGRCEIWECAPGWEYSEEGEAAPLQLDDPQATYFVLSTASTAPPPLPGPSPPSAQLQYLGPIGPGIMATEHVVALRDVAGAAISASGEEVRRVQEDLRKVEGVKRVEVMQPAKQRTKR
ncbi:hypothetical protein JCM8202_005085 [Rhodotorula sphaerocarpa]